MVPRFRTGWLEGARASVYIVEGDGMPDEEKRVVAKNLRLSARFNNVVFPIDMTEFAKALMNSGYTLAAQIPLPEPTAITRLAYAGPMARKGTLVVDANSEKQFIGVSDMNLSNLIVGFDEVLRLVGDKKKIGGPLVPWFLEFQGHFEYFPEGSPLDLLKALSKSCGFLESWNRILKKEVALFGFKVAPASSVPDSAEFLEVVVEPSPGKSISSFEVIVILRSPDSQAVRDFAKGSEKAISELMISL